MSGEEGFLVYDHYIFFLVRQEVAGGMGRTGHCPSRDGPNGTLTSGIVTSQPSGTQGSFPGIEWSA